MNSFVDDRRLLFALFGGILFVLGFVGSVAWKHRNDPPETCAQMAEYRTVQAMPVKCLKELGLLALPPQ